LSPEKKETSPSAHPASITRGSTVTYIQHVPDRASGKEKELRHPAVVVFIGFDGIDPVYHLVVGTTKDRNWDAIIMIKRQFTPLKDVETGLPIKKISACRFEKENVCIPLTAEEIRSASNIDAKTGKPLKPEPDVSYQDFLL
jgi:hypothetical protein